MKKQRSDASIIAEAFRKMGAAGGRARAKRLTAQERSDAARKAAKARWSNRQNGKEASK